MGSILPPVAKDELELDATIPTHPRNRQLISFAAPNLQALWSTPDFVNPRHPFPRHGFFAFAAFRPGTNPGSIHNSPRCER